MKEIRKKRSDKHEKKWKKDYWDKEIYDVSIAHSNFLVILKNSSLKSFVKEFEKLLQKKNFREASLKAFKNGTLSELDINISDKRVRAKVKKIVTKIFENKTFQAAFSDQIIKLVIIKELSERVWSDIKELNWI